jgi:gamma-F420-2:alpha-L-glutamate ligase
MIEGWLLYNREDYWKNRFFADRLAAEAEKRGLAMRLAFADGFHTGVRGGKVCVGPIGSPPPSFAVNRTRDWRIAQYLEQAGSRVFNSSEAARVCNDKIESHLLAARLGLPQVDMAFRRNDPEEIITHGLGYPVVLKSPCGHGGGEVFLANGADELIFLASRMHCDRVMLQKLCGRPGEDVRVYVLGGEILAAVKRRAKAGFRANLSLGGSVEPYALDASCRNMVERILRALPLDYAGIDFIPGGDGGLLFNEMEDAVGSRALYRLGSHDAAALFAGYILETVGSIKT